MAGGLVGLLDDVAALAKLAAASVDDIGVAAGKASMKAAGVVVDDAAVTPAYVQGLAADRELPIIRRIATGSIKNKLLFIIPAIMILSEVYSPIIDVILIFGGCFLVYEGAHKIIHKIRGDDHDHDEPSVTKGPEAEEETIASAVRTDFILSGEIMVIALKSVIDEPLVSRAIILVVVAILITVVVYGAVAMIVKMDDVGLRLSQREDESSQKLGRTLVAAMPKLLLFLTVIGTAAMLWVGGHLLVVSLHELGFDPLYDFVHGAEEIVKDVSGVGGFLAWLINTFLSAIIGLIVGTIIVFVVERLPIGNKDAHAAH